MTRFEAIELILPETLIILNHHGKIHVLRRMMVCIAPKSVVLRMCKSAMAPFYGRNGWLGRKDFEDINSLALFFFPPEVIESRYGLWWP